MTTNNKSGNDELHGITCDVINCTYNHGDHKCAAKDIKVGPQYANSAADTVCDTFRPGGATLL